MATRYERLRDGRSRIWRKRRAQAKRRKTLHNRVTSGGEMMSGSRSDKHILPENLETEQFVARMVIAMRRDNHQQQQSR